MANNRMYLVHKSSGTAILFAKYYPNTGWYQFHSQTVYDSFFERVKQDPATLFGDTDFEIRFEIDEANNVVLSGTENFPYNRVGHA